MENAHESNEKAAVVIICSPDREEQVQSSPKIYECNFCKKGFSNAQALGGHMNIHRKDKAKMKQAAAAAAAASRPEPHQLRHKFINIPMIAMPAPLFRSRSPNTMTNQPSSDVHEFTSSSSPIKKCPRTSPPGSDDPVRSSPEAKKDHQKMLQIIPAASFFADQKEQGSSRDDDKAGAIQLVTESSKLNEENSNSYEISDATELDLELRLGHEPLDLTRNSKATLGTIKFF